MLTHRADRLLFGLMVAVAAIVIAGPDQGPLWVGGTLPHGYELKDVAMETMCQKMNTRASIARLVRSFILSIGRPAS
jgi:hypothetical protein